MGYEAKIYHACITFAGHGMAVSRTYTNSDGEIAPDISYTNIVAWDRLAEVAGQHLNKGQPASAEGRLRSDTWRQRGGQKRSNSKVTAQDIPFPGGGKDDDSEGKNLDDDIHSNHSSFLRSLTNNIASMGEVYISIYILPSTLFSHWEGSNCRPRPTHTSTYNTQTTKQNINNHDAQSSAHHNHNLHSYNKT